MRQTDSITALALAVNDYEQSQQGGSHEDKTELRKLIMGWTEYRFAIDVTNAYQEISVYAAGRGISLRHGYIVWAIDGDKVIPGADDKTHRLIFSNLIEATAFAEKHDPKVRVFITGPLHEQWVEIPGDKRRL